MNTEYKIIKIKKQRHLKGERSQNPFYGIFLLLIRFTRSIIIHNFYASMYITHTKQSNSLLKMSKIHFSFLCYSLKLEAMGQSVK